MPMFAQYRGLLLAAMLWAAVGAAGAAPPASPVHGPAQDRKQVQGKERKPAPGKGQGQASGQAPGQHQGEGEDARTQAHAGALADGASSAVAIAAGAPINPIFPVLGLAFKAATLRHAESLPEAERPRAYAMAAASWQGSAAGNACAAVSVLSGGSFLPACLVLGVAWGWKTWSATEAEREQAERCAALRASAHKPKLRCAVPGPANAPKRRPSPTH